MYAPAHLGHARAYVAFDVLRRVLSDFFGYDVTYVMNVTVPVSNRAVSLCGRTLMIRSLLVRGKHICFGDTKMGLSPTQHRLRSWMLFGRTCRQHGTSI